MKDITAFGQWAGRDVPLAETLNAGIPAFFRKDIGAVGRYLPGNDDLPNNKAGDAWYLYVPLAGLADLARMGDPQARDLFLKSLPYAMRVARHFGYRWPVQYDPKTLDVIVGGRSPGQPGESDLGGVYAHMMMMAWDLTADETYREEARKAVQALEGYGFNIGYQFNLTAWAAVGALRVWTDTGDVFYKEMSYVLLASLFQNAYLWTSRLGAAKYFPSFLGVSCLHNGRYKATYEEHDVYTALRAYLDIGKRDIAPSVRLLVTEMCRYMLDEVWHTYPSELPEDEIAAEPKNGWIDRRLAFPLEDLYVGWEKPGQVGQEVYGAGAPMAFTVRSWYKRDGVPFMVYSDIPTSGLEQPYARTLVLNLLGEDGYPCRLRLIPDGRKPLPDVRLTIRHHGTHRDLEGTVTPEGHLEYAPDAECSLTIQW